jgi:hypothetical protein
VRGCAARKFEHFFIGAVIQPKIFIGEHDLGCDESDSFVAIVERVVVDQ